MLEYNTVTVRFIQDPVNLSPGALITKIANEMAVQKWELVTVFHAGLVQIEYLHLVFKKEKE